MPHTTRKRTPPPAEPPVPDITHHRSFDARLSRLAHQTRLKKTELVRAAVFHLLRESPHRVFEIWREYRLERLKYMR